MDAKLAINILLTCKSIFVSTMFIFCGYPVLAYAGDVLRWINKSTMLFVFYGGCCLILITLAWLSERCIIHAISTMIWGSFLLAYFLVFVRDIDRFAIARFSVVILLSGLNWYVIKRITQYEESIHTLKTFFKQVKKQHIVRYVIQAFVFIGGLFPGGIMPFGVYLTFGHAFLPVPKIYQDTPHEEVIGWMLFMCCGFCAILLPAVFSIWLFIRGTGSVSRILASFASGLAVGAAASMIYTSIGGWGFTLR